MAKRKAGSDEGSPHSKRKRLGQDLEKRESSTQTKQVIRAAEDLQSLFSSTQLQVDELIQKARTFGLFLDSVANPEGDDRTAKISILLDYLRPYVFHSDEDTARLVPDVIKMAHHAGQINSENLFSSTVAALALLLKTISSLLEFRDIGNSFCRVILHEDHIKLLEHGMAAARFKEHLVSPCLRLLKEIVLFDGGRAAHTVYRLRHITFQRLDIFLNMHGISKDDERGTRRRHSVRNTTISYLLANLRLQSQSAKCFILGQSKWMRSLIADMSNDPHGLICATLDTLRKEVVENEKLPLPVIAGLFDGWTLSRLAGLYSYKNESQEDEQESVKNAAHTLLEEVCASSDHGLLAAVEKKRGRDGKDDNGDDSEEEEGLPCRDRIDTRKIQRNVLSLFQRLRPHASTLQSDLLLSCFRNHPQMLGQYFSDLATFSFDPKLSATWIGYAQFLLGIIQLPLPEQIIHLCAEGNENSVEILLHFILPPPLSQKALTQCLNQKSDLITFLITRILVAAFEKYSAANQSLNRNQQHRKEKSKNTEAKDKLLAGFSKRLPKIKDVTPHFKICPAENVMLRESISRLLMLYHSKIPQLAIGQTADGSLAISNALIKVDEEGLEEKKDGMLLLEVEHVIEIASQLPDMHWWHESSTSLSPYTSLLKLFVEQKEKRDLIRELLKSVAEESSIVCPGTNFGGIEVLILSLESQIKEDRGHVYAFLDNCIKRCAKRTVSYTDQLHNLLDSIPSNGVEEEAGSPPDLILVTFMEQLPYLIARQSDGPVEAVIRFLRNYINISALRGTNRDALVIVRDALLASLHEKDECQLVMGKALQEPLEPALQAAFDSLQKSTEDPAQSPESPRNSDMRTELMTFVPEGPPAEDENHRGLTRWMREDIEDTVTDGAVGELILCLCSAHGEVRQQALAGLKAFIKKLEHSGHKEWQQIHLLAGELAETADATGLDRPLPYFVGVFATRLLQVLVDPLHILYAKVNVFLGRGPQWTPGKLPSYWVDKIILRPPTDDNSHYQEIEWLLDTLIDSLRSPNDMEIYRRCQVIERMLTLAVSADLPELCFEKIIDLLFRCTYVEGSTTLITRCGLVGWLSTNIATRDDAAKSKLKLLGRRVYETCDQTWVNTWSNEILVAMLEGLDM